MATERLLRTVEFVLWVAAVGAVVVVLTAGAGYVVGDGPLGAKYALFVVGILLFGVGSYGIQPVPLHKDERRLSLDGPRETRLEAAIQRVPPLRDDYLPVERRVGRGPKLFVTSLVVLAASALLEVGLGVRV